MQKQIFNINLIDDTKIEIQKNDQVIYEILISEKTISLATLYTAMEVDVNDNYAFKKGLKKYDTPQKDSERIFNNVCDFMNRLLFSLNKKLDEIRERQQADQQM